MRAIRDGFAPGKPMRPNGNYDGGIESISARAISNTSLGA